MSKPFPKEFRRYVIAVARQGDQLITQVARSFGVSESGLADREDGLAGRTSSTPASSGDGAGGIEAENRELRKRTNSWSRRARSPAGRRPTSPATPLPE